MQSLEALLGNLREAGYDLGHGDRVIDGEAIVRALQSQEDQRKILQGARAMTDGCGTSMAFSLVCASSVRQQKLGRRHKRVCSPSWEIAGCSSPHRVRLASAADAFCRNACLPSHPPRITTMSPSLCPTWFCASCLPRGAGDAEAAGFTAVAAEISPQQLRSTLTFPPAYGPTDWGPMPFLPDPDLLVQVGLSISRSWHVRSATHG